jgi:CubicO group peptidase (beta-lactamase class C family)
MTKPGFFYIMMFFIINLGLFLQNNHAQSIKKQVEMEITKGNILGAVVMAGTPDEILYFKAFGERDTGKAMRKNCIFDVSSVTKPSTVGTALAILLEQGKISLDDKLKDHLPAFTAAGSEEITLRQTATHTSGIDNTKQIQKKHKGEALMKAILEYDTLWAPGTRYHYSCLGFIRLGEMIANVTGQPFDSFCEQHIFEPLDMKDTQFGPLENKDKLKRMAKTTASLGQIQDPNMRSLGRPGGNSGMFTTAEDLSKLASMWLQKGYYNKRHFFSENTWKMMTSRQTNLASRGITWAIVDHSFAPENLSTNTFYHTGYNGHALWIDPDKNLYVIVLTVWKHPDIKASAEEGRQARVRITRAVVDYVFNENDDLNISNQ